MRGVFVIDPNMLGYIRRKNFLTWLGTTANVDHSVIKINGYALLKLPIVDMVNQYVF